MGVAATECPASDPGSPLRGNFSNVILRSRRSRRLEGWMHAQIRFHPSRRAQERALLRMTLEGWRRVGAGRDSQAPLRIAGRATNSLERLLQRAIRFGGIRLEGVGMRHGDDVVAAIDEMDLAGDAGREVGEEVEAGAAELVEGNAAAQRRMALLEAEHVARIGDAGARKGTDRPGRYRVDADAAGAEIDRQITYRSLERGLGDPHGIVV